MLGLIFKLLKLLIRLAIYFIIFAAVVVLIPNLPPYSKFTQIELEPTVCIKDIKVNDALSHSEKLFENKLLGPEAFEIYKNEVYTSLATGEIVKLSPGGHVTFVTKVGQPCSGTHEEEKCGRPLGFAFDEDKNLLYINDAYHGIWKVDLKNDKKQLLVSPRVEIQGRKPHLFNSIALDKDGNFYWTDSSSEFSLGNGLYSCLADPTGRLFYYDAKKNQSEVLIDDIWFANGVTLSPDRQYVVVSETSKYRLLKYYIAGPKKGSSEVFSAGLPGAPDNLRTLPDGSGYMVGLYVMYDDQHPLLMRTMAQAPLARKFLARLMRLLELPIEFLNQHFPNVALQEILAYIGSFRSIGSTLPPKSGVAIIDLNGKIKALYTNNKGNSISDAIVVNDKLYMGSPHSQNYVAVVNAPEELKKAFTLKPQAVPNDSGAKPTAPAKEKVPEQKNIKKEVPVAAQEKKDSKPEQKAPKTPPAAKTNEKPDKKEKVDKPKAEKKSDSKSGKESEKRKVPNTIPITEDIPSDTMKPKAPEKLKVIKKDGPGEIPNNIIN